MILALLALLAPAPAARPEPPPGKAVSTIRALRKRYNLAIAAHDMAAIQPLLEPDYVVLPGSSGVPLDSERLSTRLFADPTLITYMRRPRRVTVSRSGKRAAETGIWTGTWLKPDGVMRLTGIYQAMWVPSAGTWRLRNESFVSLRCSGSTSCPNVD
jgi:ketosteroid isomerase-like protein